MSELKPCKCMSNDVAVYIDHVRPGIVRYGVHCRDCENSTGLFYKEQDAISFWNDRPLEDALQAKINEQEKVIEKFEYTLGNILEKIEAGKSVTDGYLDGIARVAKEALGE